MAPQFSSFATPANTNPFAEPLSVQEGGQIAYDQSKIDAANALSFEPTKLQTKQLTQQQKLAEKQKAAGIVDTDGYLGNLVDAAQYGIGSLAAKTGDAIVDVGLRGYKEFIKSRDNLTEEQATQEIGQSSFLDKTGNFTGLDKYKEGSEYGYDDSRIQDYTKKFTSTFSNPESSILDQISVIAEGITHAPEVLASSSGDIVAAGSGVGLAAIIAGQANETLEERAKIKGTTDLSKEDYAIAGTTATIYGLINRLSGGMVGLKTTKKELAELAKNIAPETWKAAVGHTIKKAGVSGLGEGVEEALQGASEVVGQKLATSKQSEILTKDTAIELGAQAALGLGAGVGTGGTKQGLTSALQVTGEKVKKKATERRDKKEKAAASSFSDAGYATQADKTTHQARTEADLAKIESDIATIETEAKANPDKDFTQNITQLKREQKLTQHALDQIKSKSEAKTGEIDYDNLSNLDGKQLTETLSTADNDTLSQIIAEAKIDKKVDASVARATKESQGTVSNAVDTVKGLFTTPTSKKVIDEATRIRAQRKASKAVYDPAKPIEEQVKTFVEGKFSALTEAAKKGKDKITAQSFKDTAKATIQLVENSDLLGKLKNIPKVKETINHLETIGTITKARADSLRKKLDTQVVKAQNKVKETKTATTKKLDDAINATKTKLQELNKKLSSSDTDSEKNIIRDQIKAAQKVYDKAREDFDNFVEESKEVEKELDEKTKKRNEERDSDKPTPNVVTDTVKGAKVIAKESKVLYDKMIDKIKNTNVRDSFKKVTEEIAAMDYEGMYRTLREIGKSEDVNHNVSVVTTLVDSNGKPLINNTEEC